MSCRLAFVLWLAIGVCAHLTAADITNVTQGTTHPTIQDAIDLAVDVDEIVVDPGEYFEELNLLGKAITLRSKDPTDAATVIATVIKGDGYGSVIRCVNGEPADTVISGFVITGGANTTYGGGVHILESSPTISNCTFTDNSTYFGSGIHSADGSPLISNCTFDNNHSTYGLGAGFSSWGGSPTVAYCTFTNNSADFGGGVYTEGGELTVTNCTFINNSVFIRGGGVATIAGCSPTIIDCIFDGNVAAEGGGMYSYGGSPTVTGCTFTHNSARHGDGGGIWAHESTLQLADSVVCGNKPGQINGDYVDAGGNAIGVFIPPPAAPVATCPEDINGDGVVDQQDLGALLAVYDQNCP